MPFPAYFSDMPVSFSRPEVVVRVLSGFVWDAIMFRQWQDSLLGHAPPPRLAKPGSTMIHVTDPQSLAVCTTAEDFAYRLSLRLTQPRPRAFVPGRDPLQDIRLFGCALIYFQPAPGTRIDVPPPTPVHGGLPANWGLTSGGAREWLLHDNPILDGNLMDVFFVNTSGTRWGPIRP